MDKCGMYWWKIIELCSKIVLEICVWSALWIYTTFATYRCSILVRKIAHHVQSLKIFYVRYLQKKKRNKIIKQNYLSNHFVPHWLNPIGLTLCNIQHKTYQKQSYAKKKKTIKQNKKNAKDVIKRYRIGNGLLTRFGDCPQDTTYHMRMATAPMAVNRWMTGIRPAPEWDATRISSTHKIIEGTIHRFVIWTFICMWIPKWLDWRQNSWMIGVCFVRWMLNIGPNSILTDISLSILFILPSSYQYRILRRYHHIAQRRNWGSNKRRC